MTALKASRSARTEGGPLSFDRLPPRHTRERPGFFEQTRQEHRKRHPLLSCLSTGRRRPPPLRQQPRRRRRLRSSPSLQLVSIPHLLVRVHLTLQRPCPRHRRLLSSLREHTTLTTRHQHRRRWRTVQEETGLSFRRSLFNLTPSRTILWTAKCPNPIDLLRTLICL